MHAPYQVNKVSEVILNHFISQYLVSISKYVSENLQNMANELKLSKIILIEKGNEKLTH